MRPRDLQRLWLVPLLAVAGLGAAGSNGSPVAQAVQNRDQVAVKALLKQHADVNLPTADGTTALHWAAHWKDSETAKLLIGAGANVNAANRYGATPLWMASSSGDAGMVETLLTAGADPNKLALRGEPPLMAAARTGSVPAVKALLAGGADVNAKESWRGQTALMWAVGDYEPHPDVVRVLLEHGADVNIRSTGGAEAPRSRSAGEAAAPAPVASLTALSFAVRQNDMESTRLLLKAGANVNDNKMPGGMTPLLMAINNGDEDLALFLLDNGADPQIPNGAGFTPLHTAVRKRGATERTYRRDRDEGGSGSTGDALLKALLVHGANPNAQLPSKPQPPNFNPIAYPAIMGVQYGGATPLWLAANKADLEAMRILVAAGADPRLPAMLNTTPLMVAAGLGYGLNGPSSTLGNRIEDTEEAVIAAVTQLLEWGNDINAVNDNGQTAMHGAAMSASPKVVQFLADHGARLNQKDTDGRTPLVYADDNRTDKYRSNQELNPTLLEPTYALLRKLSGETDLKQRF